MAEEEDSRTEAVALRHRFQNLISELKSSSQSPLDASNSFCQDFCQVLMNHGSQWKPDEDPVPLLAMYTVAIVCYAEARPFLCPECEHVTEVLDKLSWSCLNLLLSFSEQFPGALWERFQSSVKVAHGIFQAHGNSQLHTLFSLAEYGVWTDTTLCSLLSNNMPDVEKVQEFLVREGPELLHMRVKHLIKQKLVEKAARLARTCTKFPEFGGKKNFKQMYLVCLCEIKSQQELMQEIKEIDCKDALDMICNLESEEDEKGALSLCTAFFKRQLLSGDVYCAWELTLFWSKLLIRLESKPVFLEQCRLLSRLSGSVYHILLLIKVIQAEVGKDGLSVCIEMCIQALKIGVHDKEDCNITICKTISCLLPLDLEVKRACQLTEFLVNPSLDSFYAVETLFNEPDQKIEEEDPPIVNSLRCDLLLALKTKWPFDPEFWDWKTLKRHCIALMSQEATAILSADKLSDSEDNEGQDPDENDFSNLHLTHSPTYELSEVEAERKKKREMKKMRERGFVSARFRNWQAYMQYCVLCDKEFLGHRIVKHALKHVQDGIFHCPICTKTFETRAILEPHVASHVKQSCKERLAAMNATKKGPSLDTKLTSASSTLIQDRYINTAVQVKQGITFSSNNFYTLNSTPSKNKKGKIRASSPRQGEPVRDVNNTKDCSCPVSSCQKVFKYFRNLVAHVRAHKNEQEATHFLEKQSKKATCQYCHRQFVNVTHLNDHLQLHRGEKPYFCFQLGCNCSFSSHTELLVHRKEHAEFQAQCTYPNCEKVFSERYLLYDHEAQHYMVFSCKRQNCGKAFRTLSELDLHQKDHAKQDHPAIEEGSHSQLPSPAKTCLALALSPNSQINKVSQEPCLVKMKCSVKSMLDTVKGSAECTAPLTASKNDFQKSAIEPDVPIKQLHLKPCYVKLEPIPIKREDPTILNALRNADSFTQSLLKDEKLFSFPSSKPKISTLKSSPSITEVNNEESLTHICPFETCTRKYSTSKSLSRHVKNVHAEAFEEWKLSKKYKRISKIAARKASSEDTNTSSRKTKKCHSKQACQHDEGIEQTKFPDSLIQSPASILSGHNSMQPLSAKFCSQLESTQSDTAIPNQTGLMQLPISQTWATPSTDNMDAGFSVQNHYPPMILSENHASPSYHSGAVLDYASASSYEGIAHVDAHTPSSVMNEASKYVSSSLRVLHALNCDQTCDLSQAESGVDLGYNQIGHKHSNEISLSTNLLHTGPLPGQNFSPYFSTFPSEPSPISVQSLGNSNKEMGTDALFSSEIKCMSNLATPYFKEQSEDFAISAFNDVPLIDETNPRDFCNPELSLNGKEGLHLDDQIISSSLETTKTKKIKSSKRTKWPAIIQDGKVICCRCYREFSSTKSLGGHLSKRSQCKPVDEIDLTADLPTSFLDFLNDPDISTVQMPLPTSNMHDQNHESFIGPPLESNIFNASTITSTTNMLGTNCSIQNTNMSTQDPYEIIQNSTFFHPSVPEKDIEIKHEVEITPTNTGEDGKIVEIEMALERLDLVDILNQDTFVSESSDLLSLSSKTETRNDNCHTIKDDEENEQKVNLKPFRCKEGCVYGAMTKEALFKHLSRVHDYSEDRINEMKKNPDKLAPYSCHLCSKSFTRTTGLKIHYRNVHRFSKEELSCLKIGLGGKKIRKSTADSEGVKTSPIIKQGTDSLHVQFHSQINPKLTNTSLHLSEDVQGEAANAARRNESPTQDSLKVFSPETCRTLEGSQINSVYLGVLSDTFVKPLQIPSVSTENHVSDPNEPGIFAMQELSGGSPYAFGTRNAPDNGTEGATTQLNGQTETNSNVVMGNIDSGDSSGTLGLYRPYRCVIEGCMAAFSIEQNLILHYRVMHQSDEKTASSKEAERTLRVQEYKCQVKKCSKVVSKVTSLLKHYLLLHRCTLEKASALLSGVEVGTFQCDQSKCSAHFTCHLKYIDHIKNDHKAIKVSADGDFESVDLTFQCKFEGCDRVYTTKSNLLRHLMKKHHVTFKTMKKNGNEDDVQSSKLSTSADPNGKENTANNNIKVKRTNSKRKSNTQNHLMTFVKPALKSVDEASAMCNKTFPLQYPCMIQSCDSVMSAEQTILKHYTTHGLTEQFIEDQRGQFIFCKKSSDETRPDGTSKDTEMEQTVLRKDQTENSEVSFQDVGPEGPAEVQTAPDIQTAKDSEMEQTVLHEDQTENSEVSFQDVGPEVPADVLAAPDVLVHENSTATTMPVVKRKRGRPRKSECRNKISLERKLSLRKCMLKVSGSILTSSYHKEKHVEKEVALKLHRPSKFETSVLKFNRDSSAKNSAKRKINPRHWKSKQQRTLQTIIRKRGAVKCIVNFRNPLKIKTVKNVKIVMHENISTCSDLLLKQLQDMQPMVILKKWLHS
ncbi:zinc finger protein 292a [Xyrauchen texanus]|uniref:zinc finger protein 292a n=1 Tax=Xyrauchen texanus TaxID=154827 RepID=UPI00224217F9|nr:zinc finger protein 292a [Xyrauchen texanus]